MLGIEDTSPTAVNDLLSMASICAVFENGIVSMAQYSWGQDRINQGLFSNYVNHFTISYN